jgi:ubiquinone/menaquinone biosynthesis C-methylase UbiE
MASAFDPGGFSNVDASGSPDDYSANLDRARAVAAIIENRLLVREALALSPGDSVLDIGSGNGEEALEIAQVVGPGGRVVGADLSSALVEEAKQRTPAALENIKFMVADAHNLPFSEGEFDAVRAERVLQHVECPAQVAREMVRVVRSGGRVAGWEPDWDLTFISSSDQETSAAVTEHNARAVRNPRVGRNLAALLGQAGLSKISVIPRIGLWETLDAIDERIGPRAAVAELIDEGKLTDDRADRWLTELRADAAAGRLTAGVCGFVVGGEKP